MTIITPPISFAGEDLREIIKKIRDSTFEYRNRDEAETDRAKYDAAQIKEMANYLDKQSRPKHYVML